MYNQKANMVCLNKIEYLTEISFLHYISIFCLAYLNM